MKTEKRDTFSSKLGLLMAVIASAVGLGCIWRFPYLLGENGGGAFLLLYLIFMLLIGMPVMIAEFVIGRKGQRNTFRSFKELSPKSHWYIIGLGGIFASALILSFYSTVSGWALHYMMVAAKNIFTRPVGIDHELVFATFTSGIGLPLFWMVAFISLSAAVVILGVQKGIEKYSKILMPILFFSLIILVIKGLTLSGSYEGVKFLFYPDFSKINTASILAALGQAAFSLGVGVGVLVTFGSYIKKEENLSLIAISVTLINLVISIIAAMAIIPAMMALNIPANEGPGLVYIVYPAIFEQMRGGYVFAFSFFLMIIIAALTSAIPLLEVMVSFFGEELKIKRSKATLIAATIPAFLGIFTTLSFGVLKNFKIFGFTVFEGADYLVSNILLPLGMFFIVIFLGWFYNKDKVKEEITNQGKLSARFFPLFLFLIKYIVPIGVIFIFLKGLGMEGLGILERALG